MLQKAATASLFRWMNVAMLYALSFGAAADEFSWQIAGGYAESELAPFADTERTTLDATYYFDPVDDSRGPYALAPFLNRSSRVTAGIGREKTMITTPVASYGPPLVPSTPTTLDVTEDATGYFVGGRYVWPRSGWYVGASYRNEEIDHEPSSPLSRQETTTDGYQVFGGRYFGESTSLDLGAGTTEQTTALTISCLTTLCLSGRTATHVDTDDWSVGTLHVRRGARLSYAISGRISRASMTPTIDPFVLSPPQGFVPFTSSAIPLNFAGAVNIVPFSPIVAPFTSGFPVEDDRDIYSIGGELFPTDRLGFRIGFGRAEGEFAENSSYDLATTWFFKQGVAVEFALARTENEIGALARDVDRAEIRFFGRL